MKQANAIKSFEYHGYVLYSPLGEYSKYHDYMRTVWAFIVDNKLYLLLTDDVLLADIEAREVYERRTAKTLDAFVGIKDDK